MVFYEHGYRHIGNLNILELREWGWEIGYVFLNWFLYKFGLSFRIFMILYNLFVFSSLGLLIKKLK